MDRIQFLPPSPRPLQSHLCRIMSLHRHRLSRIWSRKSHRKSRHVIQSFIRRPSTQSWYPRSNTQVDLRLNSSRIRMDSEVIHLSLRI